MRRLMALILLVIGAAFLAGSTGVSFAAFSQRADSRSLNAVAIPFINDLETSPVRFTNLHFSEAPSLSLVRALQAILRRLPHAPRCGER